jgi:hypothetical protein
MSAVHSAPARWLSLAAAPTFAILALTEGSLGGGPAHTMCSAGHASLLGGMVSMYLFMSVFHLPAWLKLVSRAGRYVHTRVPSAPVPAAPRAEIYSIDR